MAQYSREEVYEAIRRADAAGDGESVRKLAAFLESQQPAKPASVSVGEQIRDIPRQVGLTARYGLEALGQSAGVFTEPIRQIAVNPILRAVGMPSAASTGDAANALADLLRLPEPRTADERVVGDATRTGFSAATFGGASRRVADATQGVTRAVAGSMAANPGTQIVGGAGAGAAGGSVREAGGGPFEQFAAALGGGLAAGVAANNVAGIAQDAGRLARNILTPRTEQLRAADQAITLTLQRSGIDWKSVPDGIKAGLRDEVADALNTGRPLSADALRRLVVFRRTNTTPTVGMLTQDPGTITREANLSKTGANSGDQALQRLPQIYNQNIAQLLRQIDEFGASTAPGATVMGQRAIGALSGVVGSRRGNIDALYSAARDTEGRSLPLQGGAFTARANQLLDEQMVGGALPSDVASTMNKIAKGEMPFTVEIAEQLKTRIGNLQRASSDGGARMALGLVRRALDETQLQPTLQVNPGNLPAIPGTVPTSQQIIGQQSIDAFNAARAANRAYMQTLEANPALAAVDEALAAVRSNPQLRSASDVVGAGDFVRKFVIGGSASPGEVRSLLGQIGPEGRQALRQYMARYLKDAATNSTDDITKFANAAYRKALRDIGDAKLEAMFSKEEIDQLKAIGNAGKYMQAQPAGSAVNNSNTGALLLGRGLDWLEKVASYIPLGGRDIIKGAVQGQQQTRVLDPRNALLEFVPQTRAPIRINPLISATVPSTVDGAEDDRRY